MLCGGIIVIIIDEKGDLKSSLYKARFLIISTALAAISYKITNDIFKALGKTGDTYNNTMISLSDMPERILLAIKLGYKNLLSYDVAFMPSSMSIIFSLFIILFLLLLVFSKLKILAKLSIFVLFCGAILASQMHIILSKNLVIYPEIDAYGLLFVRVLVVVLAFKLCAEFIRLKNLAYNTLFILSSVFIWFCVVQDLYAQRMQKLAFDNEFRMLNRVVARIEQSENFSRDKKYCGVMFGEMPNLRERFYRKIHPKQTQYGGGGALLESVLVADWYAQDAFDMLIGENIFEDCRIHSSRYFENGLFDSKADERVKTLITRLHQAGILDKLEPFPSKNSVVVFEDIIVFVASKGNLDRIRQSLKTLP